MAEEIILTMEEMGVKAAHPGFDYKICNSLNDLSYNKTNIDWINYYHSFQNKTLGQCHEYNLWFYAFGCLAKHCYNLNYPKATFKNQLAKLLCKGVDKLLQCWKPLMLACPAHRDFTDFVHNITMLFSNDCIINQQTKQCNVDALIMQRFFQMNTCMNVYQQTLFTTGMIIEEMQYDLRQLSAYFNLNHNLSWDLLINCTTENYILSKPDIYEQCDNATIIQLDRLIMGYVGILQNLPAFLQKYLNPDYVSVGDGFLRIHLMYSQIWKLAWNYAFHGILFQ